MVVEISVCIATWCRKANLEIIVRLLKNQTIEPSRYEIIVVDSNSPDGTYELMTRLTNEFTNLKYINIDRNVLAAKRNAGILASRAPIVVFLDDDTLPCSKFVESHLLAHNGVTNTVFCGQVRFPREWVHSSNYYRYRDSCHLNDGGTTLSDLPYSKIVVMNLSFKKEEVLQNVGLVCENFVGYGGEDLEFGHRIWKGGMKLTYLPTALVTHHEVSVSVISYGDKIFRASRDGVRVLNSIDPGIVLNTKLAYFEDDLSSCGLRVKFAALIYRALIKKSLAQMVAYFLLRTDKISFLYIPLFYRYYLAWKSKEGRQHSGEVVLTADDVRNGWYNT